MPRTVQEKKAILKERARVAALPEAPLVDHLSGLPIVPFRLGDEKYGILQKSTIEVCSQVEITPLPGAPDSFFGVFNYRGDVLCLVNLKRLLHLPEKGLTDLRRVIIVTDHRVEIGILVDAILDEQSIQAGDLQPLAAPGSSFLAQVSQGMTRDGLILLDMEKLLSDQRIVINDDV